MKNLLTLTDKDITGSDKLSAAKPRIAVNAVLFDADGLIAVVYMGKYDLYTLPGGGVEPGESLYDAIKRELLEETGCGCELTGELGKICENRYENDFTQERSYFTARVVGEKSDLHLTDEEISENTTVFWMKPEQALKIISEKQHDNYQRKYIQKRDIAALAWALIWLQMRGIPGFDTFEKIEPVEKGWSDDKKYYIENAGGGKFLLRVADITRYERKKTEFELMEKAWSSGIPMQKPVSFGVCDDGKKVYSLLTWVDGEDAETAIPTLTDTVQYALGVKSGEILRQIHAVADSGAFSGVGCAEDWEIRFNRKTDRRIETYRKYKEQALTSEGEERFLEYVENNRHLLKNRPQTFQHGDYHPGNMVLTNGKTLSILDWNRFDFGDPWEEFNRITFTAQTSPHFATGELRGYFGGEPPEEFFKLLAFYIASNQLGAVGWAAPFGKSEVDFARRQNEEVLRWYDGMKTHMPSWYLKDFYVQYIEGDSIPYKLKAPFDFSFLNKYGKVFKVFDDQDSGNICFGVADGENKYFVKFAGAPTVRTRVSAEEAVARIKKTVPVYRDLAHPTLTRLIDAEEIGGGFAMVFEWTDAECMGRQYPLSREKFLQMPLDMKLRVFDDILDFHTHVVNNGYVAVDFYDGAVMYDFNTDKTIVCDIEMYAKMPYTNPIGRMWGSSRFMSPEEFELGAVIDEITNVYTMGATAFALFGDERNRSIEKWNLSEKLFAVAKKAVSDDRGKRQQSITQFIKEWRAAND